MLLFIVRNKDKPFSLEEGQSTKWHFAFLEVTICTMAGYHSNSIAACFCEQDVIDNLLFSGTCSFWICCFPSGSTCFSKANQWKQLKRDKKARFSRWWFQIFLEFSPRKIGEDSHFWRSYFSKVLGPPTGFKAAKFDKTCALQTCFLHVWLVHLAAFFCGYRYGCWTNNREFSPKMDGENNAKPY